MSAEDDVALRVQGVTVELAGRRVLDEVAFALPAGSLTGLIGSNGAGKTTLMRVILGALAPTRGTVTLRNAAGRGGVGYVPQKFLLDPDMPVRGRDLVGLGIDGHRLGLPWPSRERRRRVDEVLRAVGADALADARVGRLSGGEQQRILIAHALASRPRLLLLDEPLANLDLRSAREVVDLLARVAREQGVAVLVSAHEMNALLPVMDRVIYLADGRAACGTAEEVVRPDVLSRLYGHRVEVIRVGGRVLVIAGDSDDAEPSHPHHHHGDRV
ncbi:MAG TPA: metal ABC transporter ATP-binding protein [Solirubrobacteraceae bacterium]|nr:metal ABC transporter ATP-binding protein [Solirubrobacteraceae bacterium]